MALRIKIRRLESADAMIKGGGSPTGTPLAGKYMHDQHQVECPRRTVSSSLLRIDLKYMSLESAGGGTPVDGDAESPVAWGHNMTSEQLQIFLGVSAFLCCAFTDAPISKTL